MKVKNIIIAGSLALSLSSTPVFARSIVDTAVSPLYTAVDLVKSAVGTVLSPFVFTTASFVGHHKEIILQAEGAARDEMTGLALDEMQMDSLNEAKEILYNLSMSRETTLKTTITEACMKVADEEYSLEECEIEVIDTLILELAQNS